MNDHQCVHDSNVVDCSCFDQEPRGLQNKLLKRIITFIERQHCGSGEVELEDAVDPCKLLTKNYQHDHESLTAKLKLVETQLEALDPSMVKKDSSQHL